MLFLLFFLNIFFSLFCKNSLFFLGAIEGDDVDGEGDEEFKGYVDDSEDGEGEFGDDDEFEAEGDDFEGDIEEFEGDQEEGEGDFDQEGDQEGGQEGEYDGDEVDDVNVTTNISKDRGVMNAMLAKEDLGIVHSRIQENVKILSNFKELRDPNKKRTEYMTDLMNDVATAYDYNHEMVDVFFSLFNPAEAIRCIEANEEARPVTIRANTIKNKKKRSC